MSRSKLALLSVVLCCASWAMAQTAPSGGAPPASGSGSAGQSSTPGSPATPPARTATPPASTATPPASTATPPAGSRAPRKLLLDPHRPAELRTQRCRARTRRRAQSPEAPRNHLPSIPTRRITLAARPAAHPAERCQGRPMGRRVLRRTRAHQVQGRRRPEAQTAKAIMEERLPVTRG